MDRLNELRRQAKLRRDRAMTIAREEYRETIASLDRLHRLYGTTKPNATLKTLAQIIHERMPIDRAITVPELFTLMEAAEPGRLFPIASISGALHIEEKRGTVKRVGLKGGRPLWAVRAFKADDPYGAQTVRQVVRSLLRETGPLTLQQMVVTLQERGYRADVDPRTVATGLKSGMHKAKDEFVKDERGRWGLVG